MTRADADLSRRDVLALLGAVAMTPLLRSRGRGRSAAGAGAGAGPGFRIRTITAGTTLTGLADHRALERALAFLKEAKRRMVEAGYEVQTVRVAIPPLLEQLTPGARADALAALQALDRAVAAEGVLLALGSVFSSRGLTPARAPSGEAEPEFAAWAGELVRTTRNTSFSVRVAAPGAGVSPPAIVAAAGAIVAIARATAGGIGNFRFAAAANVPAGTPFFPVAYHRGPDAVALGLESPPLLAEAFGAPPPPLAEAVPRLVALLEARLRPLERLGRELARRGKRVFGGIDLSPAPGKDASVGAAIEGLTGRPFGDASTLAACAAITDALKRVRVKRCGYSGLMLPVLEDPVLARRASEGRYSVRELLLYSSVCGTGLDVVPLPGDAAPERLAALVGDMAALAVKLGKPLSARLFPVPGKAPGDLAHFDDPYLTDCVVMKVE